MDIRIIKRLHEFLLTEQSGTPNELADKLGISVRSVYNYISYMKTELNAPILFDNQKGHYLYNRSCLLTFRG
jgi:transcriptional antiterminator